MLRALSLFFNNELEPGRPLDFRRDVYDEVPSLKKKKRIVVSLDFSLPSNFKLRRGLEGVQELGPTFTIERRWEIDARRQVISATQVVANGAVAINSEELARQFMGLVTFRYIPNRSVPARLLREESQAIANATFRQMRGGDQGADFIKSLRDAASRLLEGASEGLSNSGSPLADPSLASGKSISQMIQMTGFQAIGQHGAAVHDEDWGAGHQAFFLYELLRVVDTDISQSFGWRQAAVWAVEEPESALHRDLETRLASELRSWSLEKDSRLQLLQSTHSPILTMAAESGFWVDLEKRSTFVPMNIAELTKAAELRGVSGWMHPVLSFPWNPVVLVEGESDARVLTHVANLAGTSHLRFLSLPELDSTESSGGKNQIIKYLKANGRLLQNRPTDAPLVVLFDWDVTDQDMEKARAAYGSSSGIFVRKMDPALCPQELGSTFRGIERFYPPRVIVEAHNADEVVVGMAANRPYSIASEELQRGKYRLGNRVLSIGNLSELAALAQILVDLDNDIRGPSSQLTLPGLDRPPGQ